MRWDHSGKVVLVTGGGTGIGRATALAFARAGATVVVAGRRPEPLAETVERIVEAGGRGIAVVADVTRPADVARLIDTAASRHGGLDIAFNNAGTLGPVGPLAEIEEADGSSVVATNLTGIWLAMKYEIRYMREYGGGVIINTAFEPRGARHGARARRLRRHEGRRPGPHAVRRPGVHWRGDPDQLDQPGPDRHADVPRAR